MLFGGLLAAPRPVPQNNSTLIVQKFYAEWTARTQVAAAVIAEHGSDSLSSSSVGAVALEPVAPVSASASASAAAVAPAPAVAAAPAPATARAASAAAPPAKRTTRASSAASKGAPTAEADAASASSPEIPEPTAKELRAQDEKRELVSPKKRRNA